MVDMQSIDPIPIEKKEDSAGTAATEVVSSELMDSSTSTTSTSTSSNSSSSNNRNKNKVVQFSTMDIHIFMLTVGDNPSVLRGPPLQIEWKATESFLAVDLEKHGKHRVKRKSAEEPTTFSTKFIRTKRIEILKEQGFSMQEIQAAEKQAAQDRTARKETIWNMKHERQQERKEERRAFWSLKARRTDKQVQKYLDAAPEYLSPQHKQLLEICCAKGNSVCTNCASYSLEHTDIAQVHAFKCDGSCQQETATTKKGGLKHKCPVHKYMESRKEAAAKDVVSMGTASSSSSAASLAVAAE